MNNNIDFSDFNKISIEHNTRCRKFTKHKFTIFSIISIILLIILIIIFISKNIQINEKEQELPIKEKEKEKIINDLIILNNNLTELEEKNASISYYTYLFVQAKKANLEIADLKKAKNNLENNEKIKLQKIIDEKNNLKNIISNKLSDCSKENSNIKMDINNFEKKTKSEILNRCYDSIVYGFDPVKYHTNCDGWPLLILIKTKNGENIGAYITKSIEGEKNIQDDNSMLINFDTFSFYSFKKDIAPAEYPIYCSQNNFTRFANDLIIYSNGKGESSFPDCYGISEGKEGDLFKDKSFEIDILEVYKLNIHSS